MNNRASFIEIVTATFAAGESRLFALTGQYFELIDSTFPVDVTLSDFYGAQRGLMKSAEASFNLKNTEFGVIQITSASAQTIRFAYGTGEAGTRRAAGAVSIVGTVPVDLVQADVDAIRRPEAWTGSYFATSALAANTPEVVFTAAANVNGAIVHAMQSRNYSAFGAYEAYLAKATAPVSVADGVTLAGAKLGFWNGASNNASEIECREKIFVPAGLGMWFISNVLMVATLGNMRSVRYQLL